MKERTNEEYKECQITTIYIFGFKSYFAQKHNFKKSVLYQQLFLQLLCVAGYLKHTNNTPKRNIYKYTNYNITEIYINSLSTTTQIS